VQKTTRHAEIFTDVQNQIATELVKWLLNGRLVKLLFFSKTYIEKEQIAVQTNDQATRKSPGYITWVRALCLILFKEIPSKLYKIEFATMLVEWFFNSSHEKMMRFYEIS
jgi:hypothetical protein